MKAIFDSNERMPKIGETIKIISLHIKDAYNRSTGENIVTNKMCTLESYYRSIVYIRLLSPNNIVTLIPGFTYCIVRGSIEELLYDEKKISDI
jgi:hypothetical protein